MRQLQSPIEEPTDEQTNKYPLKQSNVIASQALHMSEEAYRARNPVTTTLHGSAVHISSLRVPASAKDSDRPAGPAGVIGATMCDDGR